jgi:hypothetical protein
MTDRSPATPGFSFAEAFTSTAPERDALAEDALVPINLDPLGTVAIVLGCMPRLRTLRETLLAVLPQWDIGLIDALERHAAALADANARYVAASRPVPKVRALGKQAKELRAGLLLDLEPLVGRGLIDARQLERLHRGTGYLRVASDLALLAIILRQRWSAIESSTALSLDEVREAESLSVQLTMAYAVRDHEPVDLARATSDRQRAFALLLRTHDQIRRAVTFVRWAEQDVEAFIPSLWRGRGKRRRKVPAPATVPTPAPTHVRIAVEESSVADPAPNQESDQEISSMDETPATGRESSRITARSL